jgi:uncharacterized membrane protein YeaQ/YmgE (transglycosylase-associated protein family)
MGFLTALVAMFPCLAPLLAIWFVIRILAKLEELRRNFVLLVLSFALYGVLLSVPLNIRTNMLSSVINANSTTLADIIMFVMGALIMQMTCYAFAKLGHRRNMTKTAAFIIGLPGFLVLLAIFLFGLHSGPGSVDGSDNNG